MFHPETLWTLIAAPFVGGLMGLLVVRLPQDEPVVLSRSRCRSCGTALKPFDLLPLVSFLALGRKCRHCGAAVSWRYFWVELGAVGVAVWTVTVVPPHLMLPTAMLGWTLLTLAVIDAEHFIIPDSLTLVVLAAGLLTAGFLIERQLVSALLGVVLGGSVLWAVAALYHRFRGREGLGFGDVKLMGAGGAWVGWQGLSTVLLWSVLFAFLSVLFMTLRGHEVRRDTALPFGPFLAAGIWLTWVYGPIGLMLGG
ncbi:MAG: prepilin peptidase [Alphaproteobacteria bacterium]